MEPAEVISSRSRLTDVRSWISWRPDVGDPDILPLYLCTGPQFLGEKRTKKPEYLETRVRTSRNGEVFVDYHLRRGGSTDSLVTCDHGTAVRAWRRSPQTERCAYFWK